MQYYLYKGPLLNHIYIIENERPYFLFRNKKGKYEWCESGYRNHSWFKLQPNITDDDILDMMLAERSDAKKFFGYQDV